MRRLILRILALGTLCMFLAGALWPYPRFFQPILVISVISYACAAYLYIKLWRETSDPYSLNTLNELVIEGTYEESELPDVDDNGDKYCLSCHCVYGSQFGVCPNCAKK